MMNSCTFLALVTAVGILLIVFLFLFLKFRSDYEKDDDEILGI